MLFCFNWQAVEDTVTGVVLHECEETLQEVRQRQSAEDVLQEAPGGAQRAFRADRYIYRTQTVLHVQTPSRSDLHELFIDLNLLCVV